MRSNQHSRGLAPADTPHARALEDLGRVTWMAIGACVLLFVASLPGGFTTVVSMLVGVAVGVTGLTASRRIRQGRPPEPPVLDEAQDRLRRQAQSRVLVREFGRSGALPAPGRRVDVVDVFALHAYRLRTHDGELRAFLLDAAEDGMVLINGTLVRLEFGGDRMLLRRTRVESLPRTRGVLSLTSYGSECPESQITCPDPVLAWLGGRRDLEFLEVDELPWALAEQLGKRLAPYRE